jgi:uncharacterized protein
MTRIFLAKPLFLSAVLMSAAVSANAGTFEFTAGGVGGVWYTTAAGISALVQEKAPGITIKTVTGGGVSNPSKLDRGNSQFGLVQSIFAVAAVNGSGPFKGKPHKKLRLVADGLALNFLHMIKAAKDDASFNDVLAGGRNIGVAKSGSTDEYSFRYVMDFFGTSYAKLKAGGKVFNAGYTDLASAFKDRQIDYIWVLFGLPSSMLLDASQGRAAALLPFPDKLRTHMAKTYGYGQKVIPAGTYPFIKQDVPVLNTATSMYGSADVSPDDVYRVVQVLCENTNRLPNIHKSLSSFNCKEAVGDGSVPLHPGAEKYYREKGFLK